MVVSPLINGIRWGFLTLLLSCLLACSEENTGEPANTELELEILQLVNQYRLSQSLDPLQMNSILVQAANSHTDYMIEAKGISHDKWDERVSNLQDELGSSAFAENVASGQRTAQEVVNAWLNSEGHRRNIEGNYRLTGISARRNQEGSYYFTQIFTN